MLGCQIAGNGASTAFADEVMDQVATTRILEVLRERVLGEEFDHQALLEAAKDYSRPRDAITRLLRSGSVIRVAPGIYVFGPAFRRRPYSLEREVRAFGFDVTCEVKAGADTRAVRSAFPKADTVQQLLTIEARVEVIAGIPKGQPIKRGGRVLLDSQIGS